MNRVAGKELKLRYCNKAILLFTIYPYYGNTDCKFPRSVDNGLYMEMIVRNSQIAHVKRVASRGSLA